MFSFFTAPITLAADISCLGSEVIFVTGSNGGLGYKTVVHLARHSPAKIDLCARSREKYAAAMARILAAVPNAFECVQYLELDLASLASVQKVAETFNAENARLDVLINSASIMAQASALTRDGIEM
ncbi:hypothetical protein MMC17_007449 [Xylographa soralifera]|nr:hypothetical protein [Xylographa soralifera]